MFGNFGKLNEPLVPADEKGGASDAPPRPVKRLSAATKVERALEAAAEAADESKVNPIVGTCLRTTRPFLAMSIRLLLMIWPVVYWFYSKLYQLYEKLPTKYMTMVFGVALCFFGGTYTASIAAVEAFRQMGWQRTYGNLQLVFNEYKRISVANEQDDALDQDNDGVADVDQAKPGDLAKRKLVLAMRTVQEPLRLEAALAGLWGAYLAVIATLRLEFAQTTALAIGMVETVQPVCIRLLGPPLHLFLTPLELQHWDRTLLDLGLKFIAVVLAWWLQMIISAVYSGLRGGRMFALALCEKIVEKGWAEHVEKLPGVKAPFNPETSYFDEAVGYSLAALGVFWQLSTGFNPPFPLNIVLLPLSILEWMLRWQISAGGSPQASASPVG